MRPTLWCTAGWMLAKFSRGGIRRQLESGKVGLEEYDDETMTANAAKPTTAALREEDAGRFGAEAYDDRWSLESGAGGADDEEVATNAAKPTSLHLARQAGH